MPRSARAAVAADTEASMRGRGACECDGVMPVDTAVNEEAGGEILRYNARVFDSRVVGALCVPVVSSVTHGRAVTFRVSLSDDGKNVRVDSRFTLDDAVRWEQFGRGPPLAQWRTGLRHR